MTVGIMTKLLQMHYAPLPEEQLRNLRRWLNEWRLERRLLHAAEPAPPVEETTLPETHVAFSIPLRLRRPFSEEPGLAAGQIRLLSPSLLPDCDRPLYVAILSQRSDSLWSTAPYSAYAAPATAGEWQTPRQEWPLRVLCLWNTCNVSVFLLFRSWHVADMSKAERQAAGAVLQHATSGSALPKSRIPEVGPPIFSPQDPRIRYQKSEMLLLQPLAASTAKVFQLSCRAAFPPEVGEASAELELAAATPSRRPLPWRAYRIRRTRDRLLLCLHKDAKTCGCAVVDAKRRIATRYDGACLVGTNGSHSPAFHNGQTEADTTLLADGFALVDERGSILALTPEKA